jgi:hypothetical protein
MRDVRSFLAKRTEFGGGLLVCRARCSVFPMGKQKPEFFIRGDSRGFDIIRVWKTPIGKAQMAAKIREGIGLVSGLNWATAHGWMRTSSWNLPQVMRLLNAIVEGQRRFQRCCVCCTNLAVTTSGALALKGISSGVQSPPCGRSYQHESAVRIIRQYNKPMTQANGR